ncbi:tRNA sulfurtransferase [Candidatus Thorarchaeota archaeon]|nr:MAG: tRNA sulfurtransferase [Candidatus Thorarchaeota archaeon]
MTRMLADRICSALKEHEVSFDKIRNEYGRLFIETTSAEDAARIASRIFGVVSTSPVIETSADIKDILNAGEKLALEKFKKGRSFAVDGRRYGTHEYSSQEMRGLLGERLLEGHPELELTVDLSNPEQSIYVEVRDERTYIFTDTIKGVGGMPTGTQGKVVCTISTGLDSPIAAFKIMKRGTIPVFVYFDNTPHSNEKCTEVAIRQAQLLANYIYGFKVKLYIIPHWPDLAEAIDKGPSKMTCIFCKRNMMKMARDIAILEKADAIVTGEIIGEQASQTTANLRVLDEAVTDFPILRPLAGDDKVDIERMAQEIGTYEFAKEALECCDLAPKYPALAAKVEDALCAEEKMNRSILQTEIKNARVVILRKANK